jgi:hypothetical protein
MGYRREAARSLRGDFSAAGIDGVCRGVIDMLTRDGIAKYPARADTIPCLVAAATGLRSDSARGDGGRQDVCPAL